MTKTKIKILTGCFLAVLAVYALTYLAQPYFLFGHISHNIVDEEAIGSIIFNTMIPIYVIAISHLFEWKLLSKENAKEANPIILFVVAFLLIAIIVFLDVLMCVIFAPFDGWLRLEWGICFSIPVGFLSEFPLWRCAIFAIRFRKKAKKSKILNNTDIKQ